jgi:hypothetical protein
VSAEEEREDFQLATLAHARDLALSFDDPAAIARNVAEWMKDNFPERVAEAYWISAEMDRDKGLEIRLYERPLPRWKNLTLRLGALVGVETAGVNVSVPIRTARGITIGIGVGAVARYENLKAISPVGTLSISF